LKFGSNYVLDISEIPGAYSMMDDNNAQNY